MKTASISQVKDRLSAYLDRVRHGETVVITDRGKPVAQLAPLVPGSAAQRDARLAELARRGIVRLPRRRTPKRLPEPVELLGPADVVALISEDREGR